MEERLADRPTTLGSYTIERELGRGGMGIVYLGRDPRLDRAIAIKVLPDAFTHDPERLARFEREARLLASLHHPNIGGIYGLEQDGDRRFLVLQYIPGDTLAQRLARGPLPLDEALDVGRQIAAAVEAAHESGVIHRDLKPGNVKITPDGEVKVLDFGLAKGAEGSTSSIDLSQSPTIAFSATGAGVILGTAAYMSPEQARGKPVDRRTDIWSFGCVLYECLTGRQLFMGETVSDTIAQILERAPDWAALPPSTPPKVRDLLERCLDKDPKRRLRDIGDARIELEAAIAARSTATRMAAVRTQETTRSMFSPASLALATVALVLGAGLGIGLWSFLRPGSPGGASGNGPIRLSVSPPPELRVTNYDFSPDGRALVFAGRPRVTAPGDLPVARLYVRRLDSFDVRPVPGTENVESFYFSPDGKWIVFRARVGREAAQRILGKVAVDGTSPAVTICDWDDSWDRAFTWLPNGNILVASAGGTQVIQVPSAGGAPGAPVKLDFKGAVTLGQALPGGRGVFVAIEAWGPRGYQNDTWLLDPRTGKGRMLIPNSGYAAYTPSGHIVFSRSDGLFAVPFDLSRLAVAGEVVPLTNGLRTPNIWANAYFVLGGGNLFYAPGSVSGRTRRLMIVGDAKDTVAFLAARQPYEQSPVLTRDGRRMAVVIANVKGTYEIWFADRDAASLRRAIAIADADCTNPIWAPDGSRMAFDRFSAGPEDGVYAVRVGSGEVPTPIILGRGREDYARPLSWSPDGRTLLVRSGRAGRGDIVAVPMNADTAHTPRPIRATPANELEATYSPDGRLIAFTSDESGVVQVYVASVRADGGLDLPIPVPSGGGAVVGSPRWSGDSRRVYFATVADRIFSAAVTSGPNLSVAAPVERANIVDLRTAPELWDVMPDGRLFIVQMGEDEGDVRRMDIVVNWVDELRERMAKARREARRPQ